MTLSGTFRRLGANLWSGYKTALVRHPYVVQSIQTSFLMGTGDVIAQTLVEKRRLIDIDIRRTAKFTGLGLILVGPALRLWYGQLEKMVVFKNPVRRTVSKMALDQCCFAPVFLAVFISSLSTLQGMDAKETVQRLKTDYKDVLLTNYLIWPAAQLINFGFVPLNFQVVYVQCIAIVWNTYLSAKLGD